jgi:branched-chain amino acid aminotransferase
VALASARVDRPTDHTRAAGAKLSAYTANLLALQIAQARGAYEAALVREDGALTEGHSSNLFVVRGGAVETPPISTGILAGITRALVLEESCAEGLEVRERLLFARDFEQADEAFLTSSLREIVPIVSLDGAPIGAGRPGPITRRLHARYQERVRRELARR